MFKVLLLGLGNISQGYDYELPQSDYMLSHAQAIACGSRFELMAGVDPAQDKRDLFVQKFHKPAYANLAELKGMDAPDIVVIATPTQTHAKMIDDLLSYVTPKAILCEKPLAYEFADAKQMVALCAEHKSALFVNFIRRTDPAIQTLKSMVQDGTLAGPFSGICWYSRGLYNTASHFCDLFSFLFGTAIGVTSRKVTENIFSPQDPQIDFNMQFQSGDIEFKSPPTPELFCNRFELIFENGIISYQQDGSVNYGTVNPQSVTADRYCFSNDYSVIPGDMTRYQKYVYDNLFLALTGKEHDLATGEDVLQCEYVFDLLKKG